MIKEFDLDAPTLPKGARHAFRNQTRAVTALFERSFKRFSHKQKAWKILIEIVPTISDSNIHNLLGVLVLQIQGDPELLLHGDLDKKGPITLDWLLQGSMKIAEAYDWQTTSFREAADSVISAEFRNQWLWKKRLWNKSKTVQAAIAIEHGIYMARIVARFKNSRGESLGDCELCSTMPSEFMFVPCLGKLTWLDDCRLQLTAKIGKERWVARVPTQKR